MALDVEVGGRLFPRLTLLPSGARSEVAQALPLGEAMLLVDEAVLLQKVYCSDSARTPRAHGPALELY